MQGEWTKEYFYSFAEYKAMLRYKYSYGAVHISRMHKPSRKYPSGAALPLLDLNISGGVRCAKGIAGYSASGIASLSNLSD
jgi:hypothetical protein